MKVETMTEREARDAAAPPVLPDGDYDFEIATATEKQSKSSGAWMFEIDLRVFLLDGKTRTVRDWIMTQGQIAWRLRQICECVGLLQQYECGEVSEHDFNRRSGRVTLRTEPGDDQYGPKNRVKAYLKPTTSSPQVARRQVAPAMANARDDDDDIPF